MHIFNVNEAQFSYILFRCLCFGAISKTVDEPKVIYSYCMFSSKSSSFMSYLSQWFFFSFFFTWWDRVLLHSLEHGCAVFPVICIEESILFPLNVPVHLLKMKWPWTYEFISVLDSIPLFYRFVLIWVPKCFD